MADVCFSKPEVAVSQPCLRYVDKKFGLQIDFDLRNKVTSSNTKPEIVMSHRCRYLKIIYDVITPQWVARFGRNLVASCGIACQSLMWTK